MIPEDRFKSILTQLLEKSRQREVNWQQGEGWPEGYFAESYEDRASWYEVHFPTSRIEVAFMSPSVAEDFYFARIRRNDGPVVAQWFGYPERAKGDQVETVNLLRSLYEEADRAVTRWDEVADDLEKALSGSGPVG